LGRDCRDWDEATTGSRTAAMTVELERARVAIPTTNKSTIDTMTNTIYLITGASRGIGRGLTETVGGWDGDIETR
jgi:hypothetical protein